LPLRFDDANGFLKNCSDLLSPLLAPKSCQRVLTPSSSASPALEMQPFESRAQLPRPWGRAEPEYPPSYRGDTNTRSWRHRLCARSWRRTAVPWAYPVWLTQFPDKYRS